MRRPTEAANAAVLEIFRALCIGVDTPRSLKAHLLVKYREFEQLANWKVHPIEYNSPDAFSVDYAVSSFLRKNGDLPKFADTRQVAIAAFASSEESCRKTNDVFSAWCDGRLCLPSVVVQVLHLAQRNISKLLKHDPSFTSGPYSWGPGATFDLNRMSAYPDTKLTALPLTVTGNAWKHAAALISSDLHWKDAIIAANPGYTGPIFQVLPGGRYDTVPKTVLTDRSILIEPRLNIVLQKQLGAQIRSYLKKVRVDLDDQSHNQTLAALARSLGLATLDLEAASDTVSRELVKYLLPPAWYEALDDVRSRWYLGDSGWVQLEKFSSMGNGFTFELESLIFWALTAACNEVCGYTTIGIYGDDIITRREVVPLLTDVLTTAGFKLNKQKSFADGEFFESCGKHYYGGFDVTPPYQKESPLDGAGHVRLANRLFRYAVRLGGGFSLDKRIAPAWRAACRIFDFADDQFGPYVGEGEGYVESTSDDYAHRTRVGPFGRRVRVSVLRPVKKVIPSNDDAMYALCLMSQPAVVERGPWQVKNLRDPLVSVTRNGKKLSILPTGSPIGYFDSRTQVRYSKGHGWIDCENDLSNSLHW